MEFVQLFLVVSAEKRRETRGSLASKTFAANHSETVRFKFNELDSSFPQNIMNKYTPKNFAKHSTVDYAEACTHV